MVNTPNKEPLHLGDLIGGSLDRLWDRCSHAESLMQSRLIIVPPPVFDDDPGFLQRAKDLTVEHLAIMEQVHQAAWMAVSEGGVNICS